MDKLSVICLFNQQLFPWEWGIPIHFAENRWEVEVISSEKPKFKKLSERLLFLLPQRPERKMISDHPLFQKNEAVQSNDQALVVCSSDLVNVARSLFPTSNILFYQIGIERSRNKFNYFTALDMINNKGLTPVKIKLLGLNSSRSRLVQMGQTTTDRISLHRNHQNAGYFAAYLLLNIARKQGIPIGIADSKSQLISASDQKVVLRLIFKYFFYLLKRISGLNKKTSWKTFLAKKPKKQMAALDLSRLKWQEFRPYVNGQVADPFIYDYKGQTAVFYEFIPDGLKKGEIHCSLIDDKGNVINSQPILVKDYHLAYPFVFEFKSKLYMIPDSGSNHIVDIYECTHFPFKWEHKKTIFQGQKMVDCTLMEYDNKWWMFCNITENSHLSSTDHLHIFVTDDPVEGEWIPHRKNPIMSEAGKARPAGRIFQEDGTWYRPSQNSSFSYGYGLNINKIITLNDQDYQEELINSFAPWEGDMAGIHTVNSTDKWVIVDMKKSV